MILRTNRTKERTKEFHAVKLLIRIPCTDHRDTLIEMEDPIYETPLENTITDENLDKKGLEMEDLGYGTPINQHENLDKKRMEMADIKSENKNEIRKLKRLVYVLIVLFLLNLCVAVVALALSVTKDGDETSPTIQQKNDTCSSGPCVNQGTCTNVYPDDYVCSCVATYYGRNCEHALKDTSFFVTFNAWNTDVSDGAVIKWNHVRYNPGNNYDTVTGAYTAPSDGYYQFSVTKRTQGDQAEFKILLDGKKNLYCWTYRSDLDDHAQASCTVNVQLQAGQKVQVQQWEGTNVITLQEERQINSWFTGHMLYPTF